MNVASNFYGKGKYEVVTSDNAHVVKVFAQQTFDINQIFSTRVAFNI